MNSIKILILALVHFASCQMTISLMPIQSYRPVVSKGPIVRISKPQPSYVIGNQQSSKPGTIIVKPIYTCPYANKN